MLQSLILASALLFSKKVFQRAVRLVSPGIEHMPDGDGTMTSQRIGIYK
jgi:hypothetical protein